MHSKFLAIFFYPSTNSSHCLALLPVLVFLWFVATTMFLRKDPRGTPAVFKYLSMICSIFQRSVLFLRQLSGILRKYVCVFLLSTASMIFVHLAVSKAFFTSLSSCLHVLMDMAVFQQLTRQNACFEKRTILPYDLQSPQQQIFQKLLHDIQNTACVAGIWMAFGLFALLQTYQSLVFPSFRKGSLLDDTTERIQDIRVIHFRQSLPICLGHDLVLPSCLPCDVHSHSVKLHKDFIQHYYIIICQILHFPKEKDDLQSFSLYLIVLALLTNYSSLICMVQAMGHGLLFGIVVMHFQITLFGLPQSI